MKRGVRERTLCGSELPVVGIPNQEGISVKWDSFLDILVKMLCVQEVGKCGVLESFIARAECRNQAFVGKSTHSVQEHVLLCQEVETSQVYLSCVELKDLQDPPDRMFCIEGGSCSDVGAICNDEVSIHQVSHYRCLKLGLCCSRSLPLFLCPNC